MISNGREGVGGGTRKRDNGQEGEVEREGDVMARKRSSGEKAKSCDTARTLDNRV